MAHLEQYIKINHWDAIPDVICLQETGVFARLQNYKSYSDLEEDASGKRKSLKSKPAVTTLVRRNLSAIRHETAVDEVALAHVLVEVIPNRKWGKASTFVLNVYSPPHNTSKLTKLFWKTIEISRGHTLLIVGDFNAHHTKWGCRRETLSRAETFGSTPIKKASPLSPIPRIPQLNKVLFSLSLCQCSTCHLLLSVVCVAFAHAAEPTKCSVMGFHGINCVVGRPSLNPVQHNIRVDKFSIKKCSVFLL